MIRKYPNISAIFTLLLFFIVNFLSFSFTVSAEAAKPVRIQHRRHGGAAPEAAKSTVLAPRQGHAGPEIYPITAPDHPDIRKYVEKYSLPQHLGWITAAYERGNPYRDFIVQQLMEAEAPYELLFLPVVESEFHNSTVSRSGAAGIWQFMLNSIYPDMYVNQWMDDRRNFLKATRSAVNKLLYNFRRLQDWPLALAAYNCGLGKVTRTIEANGIRDFWELSDRGLLPPETINYVPRYMAIVSILSYPGRYGIVLPWRDSVEWREIPLDQTVDLRILAEKSGVPYNILKAGNSELHYAITPPNDIPFTLKIPAEYSDQIKRTLADKNFRLLRFYMYTISSGDTMYALARHYGVSVEMIAKYNPGIRPRTLRIGQTIIIPALKQVQPYVSPAPVEKPMEDDPRPYTRSYTVRKGDTLWSIAREHDTTVAMLSARNSMAENSVIRPGQKIKVPKE